MRDCKYLKTIILRLRTLSCIWALTQICSVFNIVGQFRNKHDSCIAANADSNRIHPNKSSKQTSCLAPKHAIGLTCPVLDHQTLIKLSDECRETPPESGRCTFADLGNNHRRCEDSRMCNGIGFADQLSDKSCRELNTSSCLRQASIYATGSMQNALWSAALRLALAAAEAAGDYHCC